MNKTDLNSFGLKSNMLKIERYRRRFLLTAGIILLVTGLAKLFTLTGDTTLLEVSDPIFNVPFKTLMLIVGISELGIAALCLFPKWEKTAVVLVAWIASGFLLYRVGIRMADWQRPCGCLGSLTDVLRLSPQVAEWISIGLLGFLVLGSYSTLIGLPVSNSNSDIDPEVIRGKWLKSKK